jgi:transposase
MTRSEHRRHEAFVTCPTSAAPARVGECGAQLQPLVQALALADELRRHVVLHADETPEAMLKPKHLRYGKTHKAHIWSYRTTSANPTKAVVFEFGETRAGENVREFPRLDSPAGLAGNAGDRRVQRLHRHDEQGVTPAQCMAHARRKFNDLWAQHRSEVSRKALRYHHCLFRIEREIEDLPN